MRSLPTSAHSPASTSTATTEVQVWTCQDCKGEFTRPKNSRRLPKRCDGCNLEERRRESRERSRLRNLKERPPREPSVGRERPIPPPVKQKPLPLTAVAPRVYEGRPALSTSLPPKGMFRWEKERKAWVCKTCTWALDCSDADAFSIRARLLVHATRPNHGW